jgi:hypothetical protein
MHKEVEMLIQYTQADFFRRMHMFLQFSDLRGSFQEIDRKDLAAQKPSSTQQHHRRKCSWLLSFLSRIIEIKIWRHSKWKRKIEICSTLGHGRILKW